MERAGFRKFVDRLDWDDVLIVTKLDRLGRNAMDVRATIEQLAALKVRVHCLALGGADRTERVLAEVVFVVGFDKGNHCRAEHSQRRSDELQHDAFALKYGLQRPGRCGGCSAVNVKWRAGNRFFPIEKFDPARVQSQHSASVNHSLDSPKKFDFRFRDCGKPHHRRLHCLIYPQHNLSTLQSVEQIVDIVC